MRISDWSSDVCSSDLLSLGDVDLDASLLRAFGKGSKERIVPIGGPATRALVAWLSEDGRGALVPAQWRRRDDADAVFLGARGGRITRQGVWDVLRRHVRRVGDRKSTRLNSSH